VVGILDTIAPVTSETHVVDRLWVESNGGGMDHYGEEYARRSGHRAQEWAQAQGMYAGAADAIFVSLAARDVRGTAFHEAWHAIVRNRLITKKEEAVLARERPRLIDLILQHREDLTREMVEGFSQEEVEAHAVEAWSAGIRTKQHFITSTVLARIAEFIRAVRNYLANIKDRDGFNTFEATFRAMEKGEFRRRSEVQRDGAPLAQSSVRASVMPNSFSQSAKDRVEQLNQQAGLSRTPPGTTQPSFTTPNVTKAGRVRAAQQDNFNPLQKIQRAIEAARGAILPEGLNAYLSQTLFKTRSTAALGEFLNKTVKPLLKDMKAAGVSSEDLGLFLYAKHVQERNAVIAGRDPNRPDGGSGWANATAQTILDEFDLAGRTPELTRFAQRVWDIVEADAKRRLRAGLISQDTFDQWRNQYQFYVPLRGSAEREDEFGDSPKSGSGLDLAGKEAHAALGRETMATNPLYGVLQMASEGIVRSEKNLALQPLLKLVRANPNSEVWTVIRKPMQRVLDKTTGLVRQVPDPFVHNEKNRVIVVKVGGVPRYVQLKHEGLYEAYKNLGADIFNNVIAKHYSALMRAFAQLQTGRNPEFFIPNVSRDVQEAVVTLAAEKRGLVGPFLKNWPMALATAVSMNTTGTAPNGWQRIYEEWTRQGGKISFNNFRDLEDVAREIADELGPNGTGKLTRKTLRKLLAVLDGVNDAFESATRLAVYKAARERGYTPKAAANLSLESTINFTRRGSQSPVMNMLWAFYNVGVNGNAKMLGLLKRSGRARAAFAAMVPLAAMLTLWNRSFGGGDDDDERTLFDDIEDWERKSHLIIGYGVSEKNGRKKLDYIKIPTAFMLRIPVYLGDQLVSAYYGAVSPGKAAANVLVNVLDAFNPLGAGNTGSFLGDLLRWASPTFGDPLVDLVTNTTWNGRPIHPEERDWNKGVPASSQHWATTNPAAVGTAQWLNSITGGDKTKPGWLDVYPGQLEYGVGFVTGGLGRFVANSYQTGTNWVEGVSPPIEKLPVARRFLGETDPTLSEGKRFRQMQDELEGEKNRMRRAKSALEKNPQDEEARKTIIDGAKKTGAKVEKGKDIDWEHSATRPMDAAEKHLKALRDRLTTVRQNKSITALERHNQTEKLQNEIAAVQKRAREGTERALKSRIQHGSIWGDMAEKLGLKDPSTKTIQVPSQSGYPTKEDAAHAREAGFGYGDVQNMLFGDEARTLGRPERITVRDPKTKKVSASENWRSIGGAGKYLEELIASVDDNTKSRLTKITDPEMRDNITRAALAANRTALATLGFDMRRLVLDTESKGTNFGGAYDPKTDGMFVVGSEPSAMVHESMHRGIELVRKQRPELFKDWPSDREEMAVRWLMQKHGDVESGRGETADKQIAQAKTLYGDSYWGPSRRAALDKIEAAAAELLAQRRPRGPR
jgi:Large polyvalent protein associated domain 38